MQRHLPEDERDFHEVGAHGAQLHDVGDAPYSRDGLSRHLDDDPTGDRNASLFGSGTNTLLALRSLGYANEDHDQAENGGRTGWGGGSQSAARQGAGSMRAPSQIPSAAARRNPKSEASKGMSSGAGSSSSGGAGNVVPSGKEHTGRWTREEHALFLNALRIHGKEWKKVAASVGTRTVVQTRTHAQKYFQKLQKAIQHGNVADPESGLTGEEISYGLELMGGSVSTASTAAAKREAKRQRAAQVVQDGILGQGGQHGGSYMGRPLNAPGGGMGMGSDADSMSTRPRTRGSLPSRHRLSAQAADEDVDIGVLDHGHESLAKMPRTSDLPGLRSGLDMHMEPIGFTPGNDIPGMRIRVPLTHPYIKDTSTPSPAACGKRKQAELSAAHILAATRNQYFKDEDVSLNKSDRDAGGVLSSLATPFPSASDAGEDAGQGDPRLEEPKGRVRSDAQARAAALQIINPESLDTKAPMKIGVGGKGDEVPGTPWEGDLENLETMSRMSTPSHGYTTLPPGVDLNSSPSLEPTTEQYGRSTLHQVVCSGHVDFLENELALLDAKIAEDSSRHEAAPPAADVVGTALNGSQGASSSGSLSLPAKAKGGSAKEGDRAGHRPKVLDKADDFGYTPLMSAANYPDPDGSLAMTSRLLDAGASAGLTDRSGNTALHWAAACANESVVELLSRRGAHVDARNIDGDTALHIAARIGHEGCIKCLLNSGAWSHVRNAQYKTALDVAGEKIGSAVLRLGLSAPYSSLLPARSTNHAALLAGLVRGITEEDLRNPSALKQMVEAYRDATLQAMGTSTLSADHYPMWLDVVSLDPSERDRIRRCLFANAKRCRTLVLHHQECMNHIPKGRSDWEVPARLQVILDRVTSYIPGHEIQLSENFDKASAEVLGRAHSARFLRLVNNLSKSLEVTGATSAIPFTPAVQRNLAEPGATQAEMEAQSDAVVADLKSAQDADTSFSPGSLQAARRAAGAAVHAVDMVLLGRARNAFCVVRPPGHHAGRNGLLEGGESCGFCIFNNIAVAALHGIESHRLDRVAIVDIDVHHGNGTEEIVRHYARPEKLCFCSVHLYDNPETDNFTFFPGSGAEDDAKLNIFNIPITPLWARKKPSESKGMDPPGLEAFDTSLPRTSRKALAVETSANSGRAGFRTAVAQRLLPTLRAFNPQLVLVSMGLDVYDGDVGNKKVVRGRALTGLDLVEDDITWVTEKLQEVADICANGRLVSVLEGGYGAEKKRRGGGKRPRPHAETSADSDGPLNEKEVPGYTSSTGDPESLGADLDRYVR